MNKRYVSFVMPLFQLFYMPDDRQSDQTFGLLDQMSKVKEVNLCVVIGFFQVITP